MHINTLKAGDSFSQKTEGKVVRFEVIDIKPIGRDFEVTFRSALGMSSARYQGNAVIVDSVRSKH
ncbi:hypothetical protein [Chitinolyticbacter meiyuanensis]|nr:MULTISPECIES: hypothetical protein [Chitinolyticbacter]